MEYNIEYDGKTFPVRFQHRRIMNDDGVELFGGKTIAWIENEKKEKIIQTEAVCSLKDNFSKKMGRRISFGRLMKLVL